MIAVERWDDGTTIAELPGESLAGRRVKEDQNAAGCLEQQLAVRALDGPTRQVRWEPRVGGGDLTGGHVATAFLSPVVIADHGRAGKLRGIAVAARERLAILPNVPTMAEGGYPIEGYGWNGIFVPVGTPAPIVEKIRAALDEFRGVDRRFQLKGRAAGVTIIDDYGHHPTEIKATLAAARQCGYRKIHVIFQPHRYSRTNLLQQEFATAFQHADNVFVLDIYAASEQPIEGVTGESLARSIQRAGAQPVRYMPSFSEAADAVRAVASEGDMVLTLGAGNIAQLGPMILERLQTPLTVGQG